MGDLLVVDVESVLAAVAAQLEVGVDHAPVVLGVAVVVDVDAVGFHGDLLIDSIPNGC
jgi:hypothetical protein